MIMLTTVSNNEYRDHDTNSKMKSAYKITLNMLIEQPLKILT